MTDTDYLKLALEQARIQQGFCEPNPPVGAVVVKNDQILSKGYHCGAGYPHAEVEALQKLTDDESKNATIYVSLEPCCTFGRTPPCTELLIRRGVRKVVFAHYDPNPSVAGKGRAALEEASIACEYLPSDKADCFYRAYTHWHQMKRPWVTAKLALSLDGKIAATHLTSTQISTQALHDYTHQRRKEASALLTTAKTVMVDDPQLNARLHGEIYQKPLYILDRELKISLDAKVFLTSKSVTIFYAEDASEDKLKKLREKNVRCIPVDVKVYGLSWDSIMKQIAEDGMYQLWVEAGARCFESLALSNNLHEAVFYVSPKILGSDAYPAFHRKDLLVSFKKIHAELLGDEVIYQFSR